MILGRKSVNCICCVAALLTLTNQPVKRYSYSVKLIGRTTLENTWVEFHPEPYLKPDNDGQTVCLELEKPYTDDFFSKGNGPNKGKGILMPDGDVINAEIAVQDQLGNVYELVYVGAWVSGDGKQATVRYGLPYPQKFPKDKQYTFVKIRSPRPVKCKSIFWYCDSVKDWA